MTGPSRPAATAERIDAVARAPADWWLLKWEATDISAQLYDTPDLSVVRGGSVLLDLLGRQAATVLQKWGYEVIPLTEAASEALVLVRGSDVPSLPQRLREHFRGPPWRARGSASVLRLPTRGDIDVAQLRADLDDQNVRQRMSSLEVDPGFTPGAAVGENAVDPFDLIRALQVDPLVFRVEEIDPHVQSANAKALNVANAGRFRVGQRHRLGLVARLFDNPPEIWHSFDHWDQVARKQPDSNDYRPSTFDDLNPRMRGYLGVLSMDGNGFGDLFRGTRTLRGFWDLSRLVEVSIREMLRTVLKPELSSLQGKLEDDPRLRGQVLPVQLLIQAGDDIVLVVRGERTFQVAQDALHAWPACVATAARTLGLPVAGEILHATTFGIGAVVGKTDTPIRHLRAAAKELEKNAKEPNLKATGAVDWAVLRSHDVLPGTINAAREQTHGALTTRPHRPPEFDLLLRFTRALHNHEFPTRQLKQRAYDYLSHRTPPGFSGDAGRALDAVVGKDPAFAALIGRPDAWVDAEELMDVVKEES